MATQEKTWNVANRIHSMKDSDKPEVNHIIAGADEIYDDAKQMKQSDINTHDTEEIARLDAKDSAQDAEMERMENRIDSNLSLINENRDEINRKQFDVVAAEFDVHPTHGSEKLVRSGNMYDYYGGIITDSEMESLLEPTEEE